MARESLLEQQTRLVEYLTDPLRFGSDTEREADPVLHGINSNSARLVAELGLRKRIDKIRSVLPTTFAELGDPPRSMVIAFASQFPPDSIVALRNAEQFLDFAQALWAREPPHPPYLEDLATFELTLARIRTQTVDDSRNEVDRLPSFGDWILAPQSGIYSGNYDIRPLFEEIPETLELARRPVVLVIICDPEKGMRVFEIGDAARRVVDALAAGPLSDAEMDRRGLLNDRITINRLCDAGIIDRSP